MQIVITPQGTARCLYGEELDLCALGQLAIERGSHVEPDPAGQWTADLSPVGGPVLGPFPTRSRALAAEVHWLETHWLVSGPSNPTSLSQEGTPHAVAAQENHRATPKPVDRECRD